jgi:hypothetical protein
MTQRIRGVLAPVVTPLKLVHFPRSLAPTLVTLPSMSLIPSAPFKAHLSHGVQRAGVGVIAKRDLRATVPEKPNATNPGRLGPRCHPI